jgi:lipopolysaccharide transport system permease protein
VINLLDFAIYLVLLIVLMVWQGVAVGFNLAFAPLYVLLAAMLSIGCGFFVSALSIRYRDFLAMIPLLLQAGTYLSPIAYPASVVPEAYQKFYFLNPIACLLEGFRFSLFGSAISMNHQIYLVVFTLVFFSLGFLYFRRVEKVIADIV